jgi:hypothetical protein
MEAFLIILGIASLVLALIQGALHVFVAWKEGRS